jgi:hypothetical protein
LADFPPFAARKAPFAAKLLQVGCRCRNFWS